MEANRFCTHCGRAIPPNMRFCVACGAEWVAPLTPSGTQPPVAPEDVAAGGWVAPPGPLAPAAPQQYEAPGQMPPIAPAKKPFFSGWRLYVAIGVGILAGLMVLGALVGEDEESSAPANAQAPASSQTEPPASTQAPATAPASAPRATAAPAANRPKLLSEMTPLPTPSPGNSQFIGDDSVRAALIKDDLSKAGINVTGIALTVPRRVGTNDAHLQITIDEVAGARLGREPTALLKAIVASPALGKANIKGVAFHISSRDSKGPFTFVSAMSVETVRALANSTLSDTELKRRVSYQVVRG